MSSRPQHASPTTLPVSVSASPSSSSSSSSSSVIRSFTEEQRQQLWVFGSLTHADEIASVVFQRLRDEFAHEVAAWPLMDDDYDEEEVDTESRSGNHHHSSSSALYSHSHSHSSRQRQKVLTLVDTLLLEPYRKHVDALHLYGCRNTFSLDMYSSFQRQRILEALRQHQQQKQQQPQDQNRYHNKTSDHDNNSLIETQKVKENNKEKAETSSMAMSSSESSETSDKDDNDDNGFFFTTPDIHRAVPSPPALQQCQEDVEALRQQLATLQKQHAQWSLSVQEWTAARDMAERTRQIIIDHSNHHHPNGGHSSSSASAGSETTPAVTTTSMLDLAQLMEGVSATIIGSDGLADACQQSLHWITRTSGSTTMREHDDNNNVNVSVQKHDHTTDNNDDEGNHSPPPMVPVRKIGHPNPTTTIPPLPPAATTEEECFHKERALLGLRAETDSNDWMNMMMKKENQNNNDSSSSIGKENHGGSKVHSGSKANPFPFPFPLW